MNRFSRYVKNDKQLQAQLKNLMYIRFSKRVPISLLERKNTIQDMGGKRSKKVTHCRTLLVYNTHINSMCVEARRRQLRTIFEPRVRNIIARLGELVRR